MLKKSSSNISFYDAIYTGDIKLVQTFLDKGVDLDLQDNRGNIALNLAVAYEKADIVKMLLANGANSNLENTRYEGPLFWAVVKGNTDIMKVLLANGANPNLQNIGVDTAFNFAVGKNSRAYGSIVKIFLAGGAEVNLDPTKDNYDQGLADILNAPQANNLIKLLCRHYGGVLIQDERDSLDLEVKKQLDDAIAEVEKLRIEINVGREKCKEMKKVRNEELPAIKALLDKFSLTCKNPNPLLVNFLISLPSELMQTIFGCFSSGGKLVVEYKQFLTLANARINIPNKLQASKAFTEGYLKAAEEIINKRVADQLKSIASSAVGV